MNKQAKTETRKIVLFSLEEPGYALYLSAVERVVRAVEITPLPKAPEIVLGVINFNGEIIPVLDIRKLFRLSQHEVRLDDQFIIARTSKRLVVLIVDDVTDVFEIAQNQITESGDTFPYTNYISGIAKIEKDIILINDLEKFLSLDEENILSAALSEETE